MPHFRSRESHLIWMVLLATALLDWSTKFWIRSALEPGAYRDFARGRLSLWRVDNPHMMLGLWSDLPIDSRRWVAALGFALGTLCLYAMLQQARHLNRAASAWFPWFAGLAAGGMLGNIGERALHWTVTDYLSLYLLGAWTPPTNVADLALAGAILLAFPLARALRQPDLPLSTDSNPTIKNREEKGSTESAPAPALRSRRRIT